MTSHGGLSWDLLPLAVAEFFAVSRPTLIASQAKLANARWSTAQLVFLWGRPEVRPSGRCGFPEKRCSRDSLPKLVLSLRGPMPQWTRDHGEGPVRGTVPIKFLPPVITRKPRSGNTPNNFLCGPNCPLQSAPSPIPHPPFSYSFTQSTSPDGCLVSASLCSLTLVLLTWWC